MINSKTTESIATVERERERERAISLSNNFSNQTSNLSKRIVNQYSLFVMKKIIKIKERWTNAISLSFCAVRDVGVCLWTTRAPKK